MSNLPPYPGDPGQSWQQGPDPQASGQNPYGGYPPANAYGAGGNNYGQPGYPQQGAPGQSSGLAIASLILGIIGVLTFWLFGLGGIPALLAIVLGIIAITKASKGRAGGKGMAITGVILGVLALIASAFVVAGIVWAVNEVGDSSFGDLTSCLVDAGDDQAAIDKCEADFSSDFEDQFGIPTTP